MDALALLAEGARSERNDKIQRLLDDVRERPMYFSSLVVETTNRCNARCAMCYQASGPKGSEMLGDDHLNIPALKRALAEALSIRTLAPRFHLAGGEAFIYMEECLDLIAFARAVGYEAITATTNAFWATTPEKAVTTAARMVGAGMTSLEISWDHWHSPFISAFSVENAIHGCFLNDLPINLRVLGTKSEGYHSALSKLSNKAIGRLTQITAGPVFPTGRAATAIPRSDIYVTDGDLVGSCHAALNLTIVASGKVFPCCAGLDQTSEWSAGSITEASIVAIANRMMADPMIRILVFHGPRSLLELAGEDTTSQDYANICDACWHAFNDVRFVRGMRETFFDFGLEQVSNLLRTTGSGVECGGGGG